MNEFWSRHKNNVVAASIAVVASVLISLALGSFDNKGIGGYTPITYNSATDSYTDSADLRQNVQAIAERMNNLQQGDILQVDANGVMQVASSTALTGAWAFSSSTSIFEPVALANDTTTSTDTETTGVLPAQLVEHYNYLAVTVGSASGITYNVVPSTSFSSDFLPNTGDSKVWTLENTSSTDGVTVKLIDNTGSYVKYASTTMFTSPTCFASSTCQVSVVRKANTDLDWNFTGFAQ